MSVDPAANHEKDNLVDFKRNESTESSNCNIFKGRCCQRRRRRKDSTTEHTGRTIPMSPKLNLHSKAKYRSNEIQTAKYNIFTFLPRFLIEQFRRYANLFFLCIALLQQIPDVSPTGRYVTAVPLAFILAVAAIKEIIEDVKRHNADRIVNKSKCYVRRDGHWQEILWEDVKVGDIIKIMDSQHFPADLVLLSSSEPQGMCYIETSNLDGETNLKVRIASPVTAGFTETHYLDTFDESSFIEAEPPNRHLYEFSGNVSLKGNQKEPLGPEQVLLRGSMLKNTSWVYGFVIYTGPQTKLMLNSRKAPLKRSSVEIITNKMILFMGAALCIMMLASTIAQTVWVNANRQHTYIPQTSLSNDFGGFLFNMLTFTILYNNLIPISLMVTIEVVKFLQAFFIYWDMDMYYEPTDCPALARTSNLNEELGQVKYVFSDKTGTLTRNVMVFRQCSIGTEVYGQLVPLDAPDAGNSFQDGRLAKPGDDSGFSDVLAEDDAQASRVREFFSLLAVCHTVIPEPAASADVTDATTSRHSIAYRASSPDEAALVQAAADIGFVFTKRTPDTVVIQVFGQEERYELLNVLEFTSDRKRMSVIVRCPDGRIRLMCKGADSVILDRLAPEQQFDEITIKHLENFAMNGLRTLCCAVAVLADDVYAEWNRKYKEAATSMEDRENKLAEVSSLVEKELQLIGSTAIEDRLQEGVPDCIAMLNKAGIKVWVLTGDKVETAVNIGHSAKLLHSSMRQFVLQGGTDQDEMENAIRQTIKSMKNLEKTKDLDGNVTPMGLVIDGSFLKRVLEDSQSKRDFLDAILNCSAVICCRVSPSQKAEMVELVKRNVRDAITLAIGDGANDVAMIQAAHVGIGINGLEGMQAVCASDYAIGQFRYLAKLLLVHGNWNYMRLCKLILYSFYKNIALYIMEFFFAIISAFSGQIVFDRWYIALYNVIFTALPPFAMGVFDKTMSSETLLQYPVLYKDLQDASHFNSKVFFLWFALSVLHASIVFWGVVLAYSHDIVFADGQAIKNVVVTSSVGSMFHMGTIIYTCILLVVLLKAGLETSCWSLPVVVSLLFSLLSWILFVIVYSVIWPALPFGDNVSGMALNLARSPLFWACMPFMVVTPLLIDVTFHSVRRMFFKSLRDEIQEREKTHKDLAAPIKKWSTKKINQIRRMVRSRSSGHMAGTLSVGTGAGVSAADVELKLMADAAGGGLERNLDRASRGYAFSQVEGAVISQSDLVRAYEHQDDPASITG